MGLTLTRKEGQDFYVGDTRIVVDAVMGRQRFILRLPGDDLVEIVDDRMVELMPNVKVCAGTPRQANQAAVVIDAPRDIPIVRGEKWCPTSTD